MEQYEELEMNVICFSSEDIITASNCEGEFNTPIT